MCLEHWMGQIGSESVMVVWEIQICWLRHAAELPPETPMSTDLCLPYYENHRVPNGAKAHNRPQQPTTAHNSPQGTPLDPLYSFLDAAALTRWSSGGAPRIAQY